MYKNRKILAIIPARGGSKGIPRKNVKILNGKPLIAYSIEEAIKSQYIDEVIVSTEDKDIANISRSFGAKIPFLRPQELSEDSTPGIEPILHAINCFIESHQSFDYVMCLQCTSPFRTYKHIDEAIEILINKDLDSIVSVCESKTSPYWMKKIENERLKNFLSDKVFYARRQDIPEVYSLNGAIYMAKVEVLLKYKNWYTEDTLPYIMDESSSMDIDNIYDFKFAELLMKENTNDQ